MFTLLKKKILKNIYFFLIVTAPIICGGVIIYNSLTKNIEFTIEIEPESVDNQSFYDSNFVDVTPFEAINYFNRFTFPFKSTTQPLIQYLFIAYNTYLKHNSPPP